MQVRNMKSAKGPKMKIYKQQCGHVNCLLEHISQLFGAGVFWNCLWLTNGNIETAQKMSKIFQNNISDIPIGKKNKTSEIVYFSNSGNKYILDLAKLEFRYPERSAIAKYVDNCNCKYQD